jgi:hypothetical protein
MSRFKHSVDFVVIVWLSYMLATWHYIQEVCAVRAYLGVTSADYYQALANRRHMPINSITHPPDGERLDSSSSVNPGFFNINIK